MGSSTISFCASSRLLWCERFRTGNIKLGLPLVIRLSAFSISITYIFVYRHSSQLHLLKRCVCGRFSSREDLLCSPLNNITTSRSSFVASRTVQSKFSLITILGSFPYWSLYASPTRERPFLKSTHDRLSVPFSDF